MIIIVKDAFVGCSSQGGAGEPVHPFHDRAFNCVDITIKG